MNDQTAERMLFYRDKFNESALIKEKQRATEVKLILFLIFAGVFFSLRNPFYQP
jgi:hypothetical protein